MKFIVSLFAAILIAVVTGLGSAWLAVGEGLLLKPVQNGPWSAWPGAGMPDPDPYSRAVIARTGQVPLGAGEAQVFVASRDSDGNPIRGGCEYVVAGPVPEVRLWTIEAVDAAGNVAANLSGRYYMSSREVLVTKPGEIDMELSPLARPGNWLPTPRAGALTVILRLYDPQGIDTAGLATLPLPAIRWKGCLP